MVNVADEYGRRLAAELPGVLTFGTGGEVASIDVEYDEQLNRGTTFGKTNVIPRSVIVHGGIRTIADEQLHRARDKMRAIVAQSLPHTSATIEFYDGYPAMSPTIARIFLRAMRGKAKNSS